MKKILFIWILLIMGSVQVAAQDSCANKASVIKSSEDSSCDDPCYIHICSGSKCVCALIDDFGKKCATSADCAEGFRCSVDGCDVKLS